MTQLDTPPESDQGVRVTQTRTSRGPREVALAPDTRVLLQEVGTALDENRPLRVKTDGLVVVDRESPTANTTLENGDERQRETRPTARSWERPARREGAARRSRQAGATTRVGGDVLRADYEGQMSRLAVAYPTVRALPDDDGIWLVARSKIISGFLREATFVVALPDRIGPAPRTWAFWDAGAETGWIGPRHTNFQDGSICAFDPTEGAWSEGGDLRTLLDLYSVWSLRHLYLETFGRWPGKQYTIVGADPRLQAYYRQIECKDDELCACGSETWRYAACCKSSDQQQSSVEQMTLFLREIPGGFASRRPPPAVVSFAEGRAAIPKIVDVHSRMALS
jgi:hypothetical protein